MSAFDIHPLSPETLTRIADTAYAVPPNEFNTAHAAAFLTSVFQDCYSGLISICRIDRAGHINYAAHHGRTKQPSRQLNGTSDTNRSASTSG